MYLGIFVFRFLLLIDCYLEAIVLCLWRLLVILVVLRSVYDLNSNCYLGVVGLLWLNSYCYLGVIVVWFF